MTLFCLLAFFFFLLQLRFQRKLLPLEGRVIFTSWDCQKENQLGALDSFRLFTNCSVVLRLSPAPFSLCNSQFPTLCMHTESCFPAILAEAGCGGLAQMASMGLRWVGPTSEHWGSFASRVLIFSKVLIWEWTGAQDGHTALKSLTSSLTALTGVSAAWTTSI